jgi:hypothetical protein
LLGLDAALLAAYELLIKHPSATPDELCTQWTHSEPLPNLLAVLEERGFAVSDPTLGYRPVAPAVAFDALLLAHADELERARQHVDLLDAAYQARPADTVLEVVTGSRAVTQRLHSLQRGARTSIDCLASLPDAIDPTPSTAA